MSALVPLNGPIRQLDGRAAPDEVVTAEDAADTAKLARLLIRLLSEIATLKRRFFPRRIDIEKRLTANAYYAFTHGLGTKVRWYVIGWKANSFSANWSLTLMEEPADLASPKTNSNTLYLLNAGNAGAGANYGLGIVTLRIEESG